MASQTMLAGMKFSINGTQNSHEMVVPGSQVGLLLHVFARQIMFAFPGLRVYPLLHTTENVVPV